jgi:DNA polymerase-4
MARRLLIDPRDIGPIRLVGVGFSGLSDVLQESLFPELDHPELDHPELDHAGLDHAGLESTDSALPDAAIENAGWRVGDDLRHPVFGHGWVQGAGHGVVSVRFETRGSGPGVMRTFEIDTAELTSANPVDSLDWPNYLDHRDDAERSAPAGDDGIDR